MIRRSFEFEGRLQGVGFRPLVYNLAQSFGLTGFVRNTGQGVWLELQGMATRVEEFESRLHRELPPTATVRGLKSRDIPLIEEGDFRIANSVDSGNLNAERLSSAEILPDLAMCPSCSFELSDPSDRRYRYPFTQCTDCGPRYSILMKLPFDRCNTSMAQFEMCKLCRDEYENPSNRRFHAQTICCADCGPSYFFKDQRGALICEKEVALMQAATRIREGAIVAVLGVGGFHLLCDARKSSVVKKLRQKKKRVSKPFALMVPNLEFARRICQISPFEERLLSSQGAPIVLLHARVDSSHHISPSVAPGLATLGLMLPYNPLYKLLMEEMDFAVVATSGNLSDEPICYEESEGFRRLSGVADCFLVHNRPIASRVDDSIVREIAGSEVVFRSGRGYAPFVVDLPSNAEACGTQVFALGGHMKNSLAFSNGARVVMMPHIGNLDSLEATEAYAQTIEQIQEMQKFSCPQLVCDLHPDYHSTHAAKGRSTKVVQIQHHESHLLSCVAEHQVQGAIFGVAWDGTGYGTDGTIWGGEFFTGSEKGFLRFGHLRPFRLPGGLAAIKEPRRSALGLLFEMNAQGGTCAQELLDFSKTDASILHKLMEQNLNSPFTSSAGRLFDAVSALLGICSHSDYEGQAAAELEFAATQGEDFHKYPIDVVSQANSELKAENSNVLDWEPWIHGILWDLQQGRSKAYIAAKFHNTLAGSIVHMAKRAGIKQVILSGGCFQNKILSEWTISLLKKSGFQPFWNQRVPPNDGGLSVGQVIGGRNVLINSRSAIVN